MSATATSGHTGALTAEQAELVDSRLALHERVALRPEPFGSLAYHYGNRKLVFLRSEHLTAVVRDLANHANVGAAFEANGVTGSRVRQYLTAIASLRRSDMLVPLPPPGGDPQ